MPEPMDLSIVIVNYNGGELILDCLKSLLKNRASAPFEIIVVDNASTDDSVGEIISQFPAVRLVAMETNTGLTKGFNRGIDESRGRYILSLDNDTVVLPGSLDAMIEFLEQAPKAGACGVKLVYPDGTPQRTARRFPHPLNAFFGRRSLLTKIFPNNPVSRNYLMADFEGCANAYPVDTLSTACMLVRREVIDDVGAFDENFFVYWSDTDWCYRIKQAGWAIYSIPTATVIHYENIQDRHRKRRRIRMIVDFHQGVYRFYRKHYVRWAWHPMNAIAVVGLTARAFVLVLLDEIVRLRPR